MNFVTRPRNPLARTVLIILFYLSISGWIWQGPVTKKDIEGRKLYDEGKVDEALSKWRGAQIKSPDNKRLHYNIGNALHMQKKYEGAFTEYEKSISSKDAELEAMAYYNIGNTNYRMSKLPEAIEDYKKALEINPDDEDAKYNIEFIKKKMKEELKKEKNKGEPEDGRKETGERESQQSQGTGERKESEEKRERSAEEEEDKEENVGQAELPREESGREMSKEDAIRLLDALKDDEKDLQKALRIYPSERRYKTDKDW